MSYNIYDRLGNVTDVIDAFGVTVKHNTYDSLGRLESTSDSTGATTEYFYNEAVVDDDLMFKEMYTSGTIALKSNVNGFNVDVMG